MNHSIRDEGSIVPCDIVAFSAHPDDMEICCGGTLALAARQGWKAGAVEFTRGELGTRGTPEIRSREADEKRRLAERPPNIDQGHPAQAPLELPTPIPTWGSGGSGRAPKAAASPNLTPVTVER